MVTNIYFLIILNDYFGVLSVRSWESGQKQCNKSLLTPKTHYISALYEGFANASKIDQFSHVLIRYFVWVFFLIQGCLIKHARALLVLSPTRNRLPTIASFLSCDSLTPQIRPGCLMTASHLSAHTNSLTARQLARDISPTFCTREPL